MTCGKVLLFATLLFLIAVAAHAADVTGKWKADFETPVGHLNYTYDLKVDGDKVTGKAASERGEREISEGTTKGDQISFVETLDIQGQAVPVRYTGKVSGDEIQFKRQVGDFGSQEFVAKRSK